MELVIGVVVFFVLGGIFVSSRRSQKKTKLQILLRKPINQSSTLQERNGCIEQFRNDAKLREATLYQLNKIGCNHYTSFYESLDEIDDFRPPKCIRHILCILLEIFSVIFCFYNIKYGVISIISALAINLLIQIPCDYVEIREQVKTLKNLAQFGSKMNLKDDIYSQESYYMREIKSIKRVLDVEDSVPILCCLEFSFFNV